MKMWLVASDIIEGERIKYAFFEKYPDKGGGKYVFFERKRSEYRTSEGT